MDFAKPTDEVAAGRDPRRATWVQARVVPDRLEGGALEPKAPAEELKDPLGVIEIVWPRRPIPGWGLRGPGQGDPSRHHSWVGRSTGAP